MTSQETIYYTPNIEANKKKLQHVHDVVSLTLGIGAGVLTLESISGYLFYAAGLTVCNLAFYLVCCHGKPHEYFGNPLQQVFISGLGTNLAGYVMMWCLVYALVK